MLKMRILNKVGYKIWNIVMVMLGAVFCLAYDFIDWIEGKGGEVYKK